MLLAIVLAATVAQGAQSTSVPFTLFDNRMLVDATIDGKGPFVMIVDTGSSSVVITPSVAQRLGLATRANGTVTGAGAGSTALSETRLQSLSIGDLPFDNLHAEVIDLSPIQRAIGFPAMDGIIGYDILRRLRVGVDMDAMRLTLSYSLFQVPQSAVRVPFTTDGNGIPQVPAAVDGVRGTFMIDTGDRSSLTLFRHFAQAHDFYSKAPVRNAITGIGVGGPIYSDVLKTTVTLFESTVPGVVTRASLDKGGAFALAPQDASIGTGLLRRFNIVYDYPDRLLFTWPSRFFGEPDVFRPLALDRGELHVAPTATVGPPDGHRRLAALRR
jgi:predicted aspartyl protease